MREFIIFIAVIVGMILGYILNDFIRQVVHGEPVIINVEKA